jgi:hypothetical protein
VSDDFDYLTKETKEALGGAEKADIILFAACYRIMMLKGPPPVWRMTHDERIEARNQFFQEWSVITAEEDRQYMATIVMEMAKALNDTEAHDMVVASFSVFGETEPDPLPSWLMVVVEDVEHKLKRLRRT